MIFARPICFELTPDEKAGPSAGDGTSSPASRIDFANASFDEAQEILDIKSLLPTTLSAAQLSEIPRDILDRALFSARTTSAEYLQEVADVLSQYVDGDIDLASARLQLSDKLDELDYQPPPGEEGTITDLSSSERINLVLDTNAEMAAGYGYYTYRQQTALLDEWPAQELIRISPRKKPRDLGPLPWSARWQMAGADFADDRMVALMDDEVWKNLGDRSIFQDALGNPYPPFAFNSGMGVKAVTRDDAMNLGLIDRDTQVEPDPLNFNEDLRTSAEVRDESLRSALEDMGYAVAADGTISL